MKFKIENLGFIDKGEIELNNLTVICGENNVGKTYLNYSIYGFLAFLEKFSKFTINEEYINEIYKKGFCKIDLKQFENQLEFVLEKASKEYTKNLSNFFSTPDDFFKSTKIEIIIDKDKLCTDYNSEMKSSLSTPKQKEILTLYKKENDNILEVSLLSKEKEEFSKEILKDVINGTLSNIFFQNCIKNPFIITSERTGISLFYKELDISKNVIIEQLFKSKESKIDVFDILSGMVSRYPVSIKQNIDYIRDIDVLSKKKSFLIEKEENKQIFKTWEKLLGGTFKVINKEMYFVPKKERKKDKINPIPIYMTSSSSKSLLSLDLYIKSLAQKNDILIIDEPEMNLHPNKQIYMAKLLAQLANNGIYVLITTHSDYIVRELNNLIMLSNEFERKEELINKYEYQESEIIDKSNVNLYVLENHSINKSDVSEFGIETKIFDNTISRSSEISDAIYYSIIN